MSEPAWVTREAAVPTSLERQARHLYEMAQAEQREVARAWWRMLAAIVAAGAAAGCAGDRVSVPASATSAPASTIERSVEVRVLAAPGGPRLAEWLLPEADRPLELSPSPGISRLWHAEVPAGRIMAVRTFLGVDAGTNAEADLALLADGYPVTVRSDHLAACGSYDAWRRDEVSHVATPGQRMTVRLRAWTTDRRSSRIEAGVVLEYAR